MAAFNYCLIPRGGECVNDTESSFLGIALLKETLIPGCIVSCLVYNEMLLIGLLVFDFSFLCSFGHTKLLLRNWCKHSSTSLTSCHSPVCARAQPIPSSSWPFSMPCSAGFTHPWTCCCLAEGLVNFHSSFKTKFQWIDLLFY